MVQRDQWDTSWGPKKEFFYFAPDGHHGPMAAAPAEICQFVVPRSPWGRLGSGLYMFSRLHRMRRRFQHIFGQFSQPCNPFEHELLGNGFQSSRLPRRRRMRHRRLPITRPTPRDLQEPICPRKKCAIWARWRPVPVKNVNYPRAPRNGNSGLVGPYTTPPIVNYKYMTSTPREGYFGPTTLGT